MVPTKAHIGKFTNFLFLEKIEVKDNTAILAYLSAIASHDSEIVNKGLKFLKEFSGKFPEKVISESLFFFRFGSN